MSWHDTGDAPLQPLEAFDVMRAFLKAYWERGLKSSDDIAVLLGSMNRNENDNTPPLDIAQWQDWLDAIKAVRARRLGN